MRMRKIDEKQETVTLESAIKDFISVKHAQMLGAETMRDYEAQLDRFLHSSRNSTDYIKLEQDTLNFFAAIPDTSPARYNKPYQYISALFNWMVKQGYILQNPITANELKKRRDDGNIKPVSVDELRRFIAGLDRGTYHRFAKQYHLDVCSDRRSQQIFQEILNERAEILEQMTQ